MLLVVCEGLTEKNYFEELKRLLRLTTLNLKVIESDRSDPREVVRKTAELRDAQGAVSRKSESKVPYDQCWSIFDLDLREASAAIRAAKKHQIQLGVTNPCFEVWFLWHICDSFQSGRRCDACRHELKSKLEKYSKGDAIVDVCRRKVGLEQPAEILQQAIQRARRVLKSHRLAEACEEFEESLVSHNPSTSVHCLVEILVKDCMS